MLSQHQHPVSDVADIITNNTQNKTKSLSPAVEELVNDNINNNDLRNNNKRLSSSSEHTMTTTNLNNNKDALINSSVLKHKPGSIMYSELTRNESTAVS